ncbi:restriction endonuclease subunit S [Streptomyces sp. IBSBF 2435]|uniref:restriction endonuclease subunit S n=1 Tax=Streptomyces sp. IBSBF 2435 TaxID=2903531 RepID=UPI002FDBBE50
MTGPLWKVLPDGWLTGQVKNAATVTLGKMLQSKDSGNDARASYMRAANVQPNGVLALDDVNEMWFGEDELKQLSIRAGDVVVVEGGQGGFGRAAYVDQDLPGWGFQNSINRLRPIEGFDGRFIAFYLIALRASGFIRAYSNVVSMPHLTAEKLARIPIPLPPVEEQAAIADYLDRETARIETLIEEQQRLIEMLRERRWSVVERSVALLGWHTPLKAVSVLIQTGPFGSQLKSDEYEDGGTPIINPSHIISGEVVPDPRIAVRAAKAAQLARHALAEGDLVAARRGELGRCAVVRPSAAGFLCGTGSALVRFDQNQLDPEFGAIVFSSRRNRDALALASVGSTMDNLNSDIIASLRVPVPAIAEQHRIVAEINYTTTKIDTLIAETERFIELSRERRSAMITAAVTGQIDVREAA